MSGHTDPIGDEPIDLSSGTMGTSGIDGVPTDSRCRLCDHRIGQFPDGYPVPCQCTCHDELQHSRNLLKRRPSDPDLEDRTGDLVVDLLRSTVDALADVVAAIPDHPWDAEWLERIAETLRLTERAYRTIAGQTQLPRDVDRNIIPNDELGNHRFELGEPGSQ